MPGPCLCWTCGAGLGRNSVRYAELLQSFGRCVSSPSRRPGPACANGPMFWAQYTLEVEHSAERIVFAGKSLHGRMVQGRCGASSLSFSTLAHEMTGRSEFARSQRARLSPAGSRRARSKTCAAGLVDRLMLFEHVQEQRRCSVVVPGAGADATAASSIRDMPPGEGFQDRVLRSDTSGRVGRSCWRKN
jgi:hypothetical protein